MATETKRISFTKEDGRDFTTVLRERVNFYFKEYHLSPRANLSMISKSIFLMGIAAGTFALILSNVAGIAALFPLSMLFGFLLSVGTMSITHDALHGAYFKSPAANRILGLLMDLFGASSFYWRKEHTVDHHTFTNIAEHDADLGAPFVMRLCPKAEKLWFHRVQHWYAPFLYMINLIKWVYFSDFRRVYKTLKLKNAAPWNPSKTEIFLLFAFKCIHVFIFLILPMLLLPFAWWVILLAYLTVMATAGLTLTVIFQLAHIVENVAFPLPDEEGKIDNSFLKHQLCTTSNFAVDSWLACFLFGGLNFQVEHHIFPHVCHMHLKKIQPIVEATALEFGLPYHKNSSFIGAVRSHFRTLKQLGNGP